MKTSTLVFAVAAVLALIGMFVALADLMKHKARSYGVDTQAPAVATTSPAVVATMLPTIRPTSTPAPTA